MKKRPLSLLAAIFLAVLLVASSCSSTPESESAATTGTQATEAPTAADAPVTTQTTANDLPQLPLITLKGERLMANELKGKTVLVLYQPSCEDCQREAAQIQQHLQAFQDYQLYFVSNVDLQEQRRFAEAYTLSGQPNVHFAQTSIEEVINTLGPTPAPSVFIYGEDGRLVQSFKGETDIQQLLKYL